jgi:hypothetical protein
VELFVEYLLVMLKDVQEIATPNLHKSISTLHQDWIVVKGRDKHGTHWNEWDVTNC